MLHFLGLILFVIPSLSLQLPPLLSREVQLQTSPLIGGPSWLPLHVKVVLENGSKWDFVPLNPSDPTTLARLLLLQSVPGTIRQLNAGDIDDEHMEARALAFCERYETRDLHLISNNCWTFALRLYWELIRDRK